ncbi:MAG: T9SS type A sorting domain-containing protein [Candidatus Delongbacteria bacterium]|jgi:tellurite resistance-related uncharacterized protein|nr:T9SS type A sorting domain-containing protein [Candidatus Delongbacteria bacterium]
MKRLYHILIVFLFVLMNLTGYSQSCTQSCSASGNDCDNFITSLTINCAPAGATITGIDITASIGSWCTDWYEYDINLGGIWKYSYCDGTYSFSDLNGNVANGTVIYIQSVDNDAYCDGVTLNLSVTVYYTGGGGGPSNDLCADATSLPCGTTNLAGTTVGTSNIADPIGCASNYGVWYTFVGDGNETTISSTATFDHEMVISSGSCGSLSNIICDDGSTGTETHTFTTVNGTTYYVYIAHYSTSSTTTGTFTISRTCTAPPPDPCASVISISGCGSSYTQNYTSGGTGAWASNPCYSSQGTEQIYSFVAPTTGTYSLQITTNSSYVDYNWQASTCAESGWTCIDDVYSSGEYGSMSWTASTTYYILLDDENTTASSHSFYINCPVVCTTPGIPTSVTGTSTGQTSANLSWSAGSPAGSPTVTYYWVVGTTSSCTYGGGGGAVDWNTTTGTSTTTSALSCGTTYYLRVYAETDCDATSSAYGTSSSFATNACPASCCIATTAYGSATAPTNNTEIQITSCNYAGDYSEISSVVSGQTYQFRSNIGTDWLSLTNTSNTCLTYGTTPITWVATFSGDVRLHIHTNSACGTDASCHETYIQCTSCSPPADPCASVISIAGCGAGSTKTYTGGGTGVWNQSSSSDCGFTCLGEEQIYSFVAPETGTYNLEVTAADGFVDYMWQANSCAETGWTCIDDIASAGTYGSMSWTAGTTYYILLDDENSTTGTHTFYINCPVDHCVSTDYWLSATAPTDDIPLQVASCNFAGEYNEITNVVAGQTYEFSSTVSTDWLTLTNTSNTLLTEGQTPISWTATFSGTVYIHIHTDAACGTESSCREQWVTCTSCGGGGTQDYYIHPTEGLQSTYLGACMVNIDCGETHAYYDDGGPSGNYSNNINNYYRTFCPDAPGKCIQATMNSMSIESGWDFLSVGNGPTQNGPILWKGSNTHTSPNTSEGSWNGGTWTSTDASGCLTYRFSSDGSGIGSGWDITLSCVDCAENDYEETSECTGSCATCGDTDFSGASTGPGIESTCTGCIVSENYTTWYYFEIAIDGVFEFYIVPNTLGDPLVCTECDDYDFALFRADECNNLGSPVRCSYAWNERCYDDTGPKTGMADTHPYSGIVVTDYIEDVNGDGYVKSLDVTAGQTYFLMVNGWSPSDAGYDLSFDLTGGGTFEDCEELDPLPVELIDFDAECENNQVTLSWSTASETNNDYFTVMKSYNGFMFKPIGKVEGQGNSNFMQNYSFLDDGFSKGIVYYQLKQTDFDGTTERSKIIKFDCGTAKENIIIINEDDKFVINFENALSNSYSLHLYNNLGQLVMKKDITLTDKTQTTTIPVTPLRPGIYIVIISSDISMESARLFIE